MKLKQRKLIIFVKKTDFRSKILKNQSLNSTKVFDQKNLAIQFCPAGTIQFALKSCKLFTKLLKVSVLKFISPDAISSFIWPMGISRSLASESK